MMKLPFNIILKPLLKPHLSRTRLFCQHMVFRISLPFTIFYGAVGLYMNIKHLRKHLGQTVFTHSTCNYLNPNQNAMLAHDLKIIATSMGLVQYVCLLGGCITDNPALFLPHLVGQFFAIMAKVLSAIAMLTPSSMNSILNLGHIACVVALMSFNWLQEFCVFRQTLCICDL
ncbi:uncharacterized protein [Choristoneura fumiferana]|uniref:uncharacterized protein n=1 Tax=Choristoneura fumiferana TaxID=7141 RepID=UPI003D15CE04